MGGRLILDLTDLSIGAQPVHVAASVAVGELVVIVPRGASVELRAPDGRRAGDGVRLHTGPAPSWAIPAPAWMNDTSGTPAPVPTYILDLEGGIGDLFVTNSRINW